jgi:hypothetical protein
MEVIQVRGTENFTIAFDILQPALGPSFLDAHGQCWTDPFPNCQLRMAAAMKVGQYAIRLEDRMKNREKR